MFEFVLGVDPKAPMGWITLLLNGAMLVVIIGLSRYTYEWVEKSCRDWVKNRLRKPSETASSPRPGTGVAK